MEDQKIYEELTKINSHLNELDVKFSTKLAAVSAIVRDYPELKETVRLHGQTLAEMKGESAVRSQDSQNSDQKDRLSRATWAAIAQWAAVTVAVAGMLWAALRK